MLGLDRFVLIFFFQLVGLVQTFRINRMFLFGWVEHNWLESYRNNHFYHNVSLFRWETPKYSSSSSDVVCVHGRDWIQVWSSAAQHIHMWEWGCFFCCPCVCLDSAAVIQFHSSVWCFICLWIFIVLVSFSTCLLSRCSLILVFLQWQHIDIM